LTVASKIVVEKLNFNGVQGKSGEIELGARPLQLAPSLVEAAGDAGYPDCSSMTAGPVLTEGVHQIGTHSITLSGDTVLACYVGDVSPQDSRSIIDLFHRHYTLIGARPLYGVVDLSKMGNVPAETRRLFAECFRTLPWVAIAVCGASVAARTIARMTLAASKLLGGLTLKLVFTANEEEAWHYIASHRIEDSRAR
jgi:hypothetical protein